MSSCTAPGVLAELFAIAIPLFGFNHSGGVQVLCDIAGCLAARGHRVEFLVPSGRCAAPPRPLEPSVAIHSVTSPPTLVGETLALAKRSASADLVIANYYPTAYSALLAQYFSRGRARGVYFVQGRESYSHGRFAPASTPSRWVRWALAECSYRVRLPRVCTSDWLARHTGGSPARIAPLGIDLDLFHPAPADSTSGDGVRVGVLGRAAPAKGLRDLLEAWRRMPDRSARLRVLAQEELELPNDLQVELVPGGGAESVATFLRSCTIFVQPSWVEGFSLPVLEAMASGCAVVTTDCGGVGDYAGHGRNAFVVAPRDPVAMAAAISELIHNDRLRQSIAANGVATAAKYPRGPRLEALVNALLASRAVGDGSGPLGLLHSADPG